MFKQKLAFKPELLSNLVFNLKVYFRKLKRKNNTKDNGFMVVSKVHK